MRRRATLLAAAGLALAACGSDTASPPDPGGPQAAKAAEAPAPPPAPPAPAALQSRLDALVRAFPGEMGVAVRSVDAGWTAAVNGDRLLPQQSVIKVWLAVALLDQVDRGVLSLDEAVTLGPGDLSVFYQPLARSVRAEGSVRTTLGDLLARSIAQSDNAATDALIRRLGGGAAVQAILANKGVQGVRVGPEERLLQTEIAGVTWRPEYADLATFNRARDGVPEPVRAAAIETYLRDPPDGGAPRAVAENLAALRQGRLLSPASTQVLLGQMALSSTGPLRLRAGLGQGWTIAHKTGTGPSRDGYAIGYNDVGLLTAPDGRSYAIAVMIARTYAGLDQRQQVIADAARLVVEHHEASFSVGKTGADPAPAQPHSGPTPSLAP